MSSVPTDWLRLADNIGLPINWSGSSAHTIYGTSLSLSCT